MTQNPITLYFKKRQTQITRRQLTRGGNIISTEGERRQAEHARNIDRFVITNMKRCRRGLPPYEFAKWLDKHQGISQKPNLHLVG